MLGFKLKEIDFLFNNVKIISLMPYLGIHGKNNNFKGWKRSFFTALEYGKTYNYIIHIEYDLRVQYINKFTKYFTVNGTFAAYCNTYRFIETACMILNDKNKNELLIS